MIEVDRILSVEAVPFLLAALVIYITCGAIYRLYFSPVAGFPGPQLAALTQWYEFYYDVYPLSGQYTFKIGEMHEKYGPIIRINPWELHISDPEFYKTLYSANQKRDKWGFYTVVFGSDKTSFATIDHNLHKIRRAAISPYFSTANIRRLQPVMEGVMSSCLERIRELAKSGEAIRSVLLTSAYSLDVIMEYALGRCEKRLEAPDFGAVSYDRTHDMLMRAKLVQHMPFIIHIMISLPEPVALRIGGAAADMATMVKDFRERIIATIYEKEQGKSPEHRTIFNELLDSDLPAEEKSIERLSAEARNIIGAAGESIASTLTLIIYHLLANPSLLETLKSELESAIPDPEIGITQATLENLPYLRAVIKEGLRLSYGVSSRMQRVPYEPLIFKSADREWIIPSGTPVGMTTTLLHHDESIFPDSRTFNPDRWIENPRLERYLVSFSKGSRQCVGMNLAYAELFLWLGNVFRRFGSKEVRFTGDEGIIELVDTDITDVEIARDLLAPMVREGSKGVMIRFSLLR